jgi:hypothetical protein
MEYGILSQCNEFVPHMYAITKKVLCIHSNQIQQPIKRNSQIEHSDLLIGHARLQVVILAIRILEAVLALLHMLALVASQPLNREVDQAVAAGTRVIAGALPPHGATKSGVLDVVDLLARDLRRIVGDHGARCWVVGPGRDGLRVVEDLGAGLGERLEMLLVGVFGRSILMRVMDSCPGEGSD